jgi:hypothetical protein
MRYQGRTLKPFAVEGKPVLVKRTPFRRESAGACRGRSHLREGRRLARSLAPLAGRGWGEGLSPHTALAESPLTRNSSVARISTSPRKRARWTVPWIDLDSIFWHPPPTCDPIIPSRARLREGDGWRAPSPRSRPLAGPRRAKLALRGWGEGHSPHTELAESPLTRNSSVARISTSPRRRGEMNRAANPIQFSKNKDGTRSRSRGAERPSFHPNCPR